MSFAEACDIATSMELADRDTSDMKLATTTINRLQKRQKVNFQKKGIRSTRPITNTHLPAKIKCYRCGANHLANVCKHIKTTCTSCMKIGHLSSVCRSTATSGRPKVSNLYTKILKNEDIDQDIENLSLYTVNKSNDRSSDYKVNVNVEGHPLDMILDSGADTSTLSEIWCVSHIPHIKVTAPDFKLQDYNSAQVKVLGIARVKLACENISRIVPITVVAGHRPPLFGKDLIALFKPDLHDLLSTQTVRKLSSCIVTTINTNSSINELLTTYEHLFRASKEPILGFQASVKLKHGTIPVYKRARPVPYALKSEVERQLKASEQEGIWHFVEQSRWATPLVLVVKKENGLRMCGDFKVTVNPHTEPNMYPLPTQKDLFAVLSGRNFFSKIDLKHAYQQIQLDEESCKILTLNTHLGLVRPKRLLYGINNASQIFQSIMDRILCGLPGILCYQDDILIATTTVHEHFELLNKLFIRLNKHRVYLNKNKCVFLQEKVDYLGHQIDKTGIHPNDSKICAIHQMKPPNNLTELRTFIGMVNYYTKFIPNASTLFHPLYKLLRKNEEWVWSSDCQEAFDKCKETLTSELLLVHYDHNKKITLACDASPFGLGAVLSHVMETGQERPIAYASRTLTAAESGYSHLEREALAIVFALKHFQQYLYGRTFTIITDHKPLISLFSPSVEIPAMAAARIQRWALLLSSFMYDIEYRKGTKHCNADALSRFPLEEQTVIEGACFRLSYIDELPLTARDISIATRTDKTLGRLLNKIKFGWGDQIDDEFIPYHRRRDQLSIDEDCILWGMRVIIPERHRPHLLDLLHDTHQGVTKMKSIARSHIWWPGLDQDVERLSQNCSSCIQNQRMPPASTLQSWTWPKQPWDRIHIDFGQKHEKFFLIAVDAHSKWIEVTPMSNITASQTIDTLRNFFARYGIPRELVSDNGPQFTSSDFGSFMQCNGVKHTLVPPYHPSSNGAAERYVQSFKNALKRMDSDADDTTSLNQKIARYLLTQHSTPHVTTGVTPAKLFLGRELRTRWSFLHSDINLKVEGSQYKQKLYHDRAHSTVRTMNVDDKVLVRNMGDNPRWMNGTISNQKSTRTWSVSTPKGTRTYHTDQIRPGTILVSNDKSNFIPSESTELTNNVNVQPSSPILDTKQPRDDCSRSQETASDIFPRRNPTRNRHPPDKLNL